MSLPSGGGISRSNDWWTQIPTAILEDEKVETKAKLWADQQRAVAAKAWADTAREQAYSLAEEYGFGKLTENQGVDPDDPSGKLGLGRGTYPQRGTTDDQSAASYSSPEVPGPDYLGDLGRAAGNALASFAPPGLRDAARRGSEDQPTPDVPGLPFTGRGLPYFQPSKPVRDPETERKMLAGEDLTAGDFVNSLARSAGKQYEANPAAMEGIPGVKLRTSDKDLGRGFARGLTETSGGGGSGASHLGPRAAGGSPGSGGDVGGLVGSSGRALGDGPKEPVQIRGSRDEVISTVSTPKSAVIRTGEAGQDVPDDIDTVMPNIKHLDPYWRATVVRTAQENPDLFKKAQGSTVTWKETNHLASMLGMTTDDFLKTPAGRALNNAELAAVSAASGTEVDRAQEIARGIGDIKKATPEQRAELVRQMARAGEILTVTQRVDSQAGRSLNILKQNMDRRLANNITTSNEELASIRAQRAANRAAKREGAVKVAGDVAARTGDAELQKLVDELQGMKIPTKPQAERNLGDLELTQATSEAQGVRLPTRNEGENVLGQMGKKAESEEKKLERLFQRLDSMVLNRQEREGMQAWRKEEAELDRLDRAYEKMISGLEARAGRDATRIANRARKVLSRVNGRIVTDEMLENFVELSKSGNPYAAAAFIRGLDNPSWYQKGRLLYYASLFSGITAQGVNAASGAVGTLLKVPERAIAAGIDAAVQVPMEAAWRAGLKADKPERTRYGKEAAAMVPGTLSGFVSSALEAPRVFRTGLTPASVQNLEGLPMGFGARDQKINTAVESPLRLLTTVDHILRGAARGGEIDALAVRQAMREGKTGQERAARVLEIKMNLSQYPKITIEADIKAAAAIGQEKRKWVEGLVKFGKENPAVKDVFFPVLRTVTNAASRGLGTSPAGLLGMVAAMLKGDRGEAVDRAARVAIGSAVVYGGYLAGSSGKATAGLPPTKEGERSTQPVGRIPWAWREEIDEDSAINVEFKNLGALAYPFAMGVALGEATKRGERAEGLTPDDLLRAGDGVVSFMRDNPIYSGPELFVSFARDAFGGGFERISEDVAGRLMPAGGLQRQIARAIGYGPRDIQGPKEAFLAASPLTVGQVPPAQDRLGRDREPERTGWGAMLSPFRYGIERDSPTLRALRDNGVGLPAPPKDRGGIELSREEQREFQRIAGQYIERNVKSVLSHPKAKFAQRTPGERRAFLLDAVDDAREEAEREMIRTMGVPAYKERLKQAAGSR